MTTNSPNPVDGDVQALIKDCQREIKGLELRINDWRQKGNTDYVTFLQSELRRQQIALAALTAEPIHQVSIDDAWVDLSEGAMKSQLRHGATARILYTSPSSQILRPVDLKKLQHKDSSWVHIDDVKRAISKAGYEVKE